MKNKNKKPKNKESVMYLCMFCRKKERNRNEKRNTFNRTKK